MMYQQGLDEDDNFKDRLMELGLLDLQGRGLHKIKFS